MSASPGPAKKTVYVDVDDEITGIIDKVKSNSESIVALVLPRRATMLQSIVNMKLLKRAADQSDKNVVLITSEPTLMPLAGAAGLHVAANLQSRPYLPAAPGAAAVSHLPGPEDAGDEEIDPNTAIGDLAEANSADDQTPIEIDNSPKAPEAGAGAAGKAAAAKKGKTPKEKGKKVPNFKKFRVLLIAGAVLLALLLVGGYWAFAIAPKAKITIRTESKEVAAKAGFKADTEADDLNLEEKVLPALSKELKKTQSEKVAASGQKDNGTKAGGSVALRNCTDNAVTIPAGTGVSSGSLTFVTQSPVGLAEGDFNSGSRCKDSGDHVAKVNVVAQNNGDQYNLAPRSYTVAGFQGVVAQGDQMSGGTSKIVKVVAQADVDNAKKRISDKQNAVVEELKNQLKDEKYIGLVDTFAAGNGALTAAPAVGTEAPEVIVLGEVSYTMLGVKEEDLKKAVEEQSKDEVDTSKQTILSYGFDDAVFEIGRKSGSITNISIKTTLVAGPEIKQNELKKELAGKKSSAAEGTLKSRPGITEAKVEFSPFWVSKVPGKESKVKFVIEQADGKQITP